jgi:hypothetical protein
VWVNPHKGRAGYEPLTGGMQAALPYVDSFVSGHSMAAFEELTGVIKNPVPPALRKLRAGPWTGPPPHHPLHKEDRDA